MRLGWLVLSLVLVLMSGSAEGALRDSRILFSRLVGEQLELYSIRPDGQGLKRLTRNAAWDSQPSWSPDGRWFAAVGGGSVVIRRADGLLVRAFPDRGEIYEPTWSPDGKSVAYLVERCYDAEADPRSLEDNPSCGDLWVAHTAGGTRRLLNRAVETFDPWADYAWSPDSRTIVFVQRRTVRFDAGLWLVDVATGHRRMIVNGARSPDDPAWSPDGRQIAFIQRSDSFQVGGNLFTLSLRSGETRRLTRQGNVSEPRWSPDGRRLGYQVTVDDRDFVALIAADGSGARRLGRVSGGFDWSADSRQLVWVDPMGYLRVGRVDSGRSRRLVEGSEPDWR